MKILVTLFFACSICCCYALPVGYEYKKDITINHLLVDGTQDHVDFPILLKLTDPDLRSVSNGGKVYSNAGHDIVFTLDNCTIDLNHQLESFDPTTGSIAVWLRIPVLYATENTLFSMYYGNNSMVASASTVSTWNNFYESVLHLHENPAGVAPQLIDGCGKSHSGSAQGGMNAANQIDGIAGKGLSFDEVNDHLVINDFDYASSKSFSVSMWFRLADNSGTSYQYMFSHGAYGVFNSMNFYFGENSLSITPDQNMLKTIFQDANDATSTNGLDAGNSYHDGQWHYYVFTVNELGNPTVYLDGVPRANISFNGGQNYDPTTNIFIGTRSDLNATRFWGGELDEFRLLNDTISHAWIVTEYNNVINQAAFFSVGPEAAPSLGCLPLSPGLIYFEATKKKQEQLVELSFSVKDAFAYNGFILEKSANLQNWTALQTLSYNEVQKNRWDILDAEPFAGTNYYRIILLRKDQNREISPIRHISFEETLKVNYYPNPVQDVLTIELPLVTAGLYRFSFIDMRGIVSLSEEVEFSKGMQGFRFGVNALSAGVYYLQITGPEGIVYRELIRKE